MQSRGSVGTHSTLPITALLTITQGNDMLYENGPQNFGSLDWAKQTHVRFVFEFDDDELDRQSLLPYLV